MSGTVDLTTSGSFGEVGDAIFTTDTTHSAGTGGFNTFVELQQNGTEQGYNTDASAQFDEKNGHIANHALLLADVPIFFGDGSNGTVEGVAYREFKLDINEAGGLLSLDDLQIWQEEAGNLTNFSADGTGFAGAHTNNLVYDLDAGGDHWIALNSGLSTGSGGADMRLLIRDDLFINDAAHRYVYLYSAFGQQGGTWASNSGFEEWGTSTPTGGSSGGSVLHLDKTASVDGGTADRAGEVITYSFAVSNFGSVALTGITVTDPSVSDLAAVTSGGFNIGDTDHDNQLDTNEVWSYTAHHIVTQADIDGNGVGRGTIENTATADSDQTSPVTDSTSVPIVRLSHAVVTKTASFADADEDGKVDGPGDDISYTIKVLNDGNVSMTGVELNDSLSGLLTIHTESGGTGINGDDILDVGETWTYTAFYDVQQSDVDNHGNIDGSADNIIRNTATVTANELTGEAGSADVSIDYRPHLTLDKSGAWLDSADANGFANVGEQVNYAVTVTNDGNVTLQEVDLTDPIVTFIRNVDLVGNNDAVFNVGEIWSYTGAYTITQADIDAGNVHNVATATALGAAQAADEDPEASGTDDNDAGLPQNPHLTLEKTGMWQDGGSEPNGTADAGEQVHYTFELTNDGNVSLHGVAINDSLLGSPLGGPDSGDSFNPGVLDVGETWIYHADYTLSQADVDAGLVHNEATATARGPQDQAASSSDSADVTFTELSTLTLLKTSDGLIDPDDDGPTFHDPVQYFFTLTNNGTEVLHDMQLDDTLFGTIAFTPDSGDDNGLFDPGETWFMSRTYLITQDDIDAGAVDNYATATGLNPTDVLVTSNTAHWHLEF
jgi:uncharacterized repeat protein (TIGR01451 family)